jgi:hypothetical protein
MCWLRTVCDHTNVLLSLVTLIQMAVLTLLTFQDTITFGHTLQSTDTPRLTE